jgi:hypothetical protein
VLCCVLTCLACGSDCVFFECFVDLAYGFLVRVSECLRGLLCSSTATAAAGQCLGPSKPCFVAHGLCLSALIWHQNAETGYASKCVVRVQCTVCVLEVSWVQLHQGGTIARPPAYRLTRCAVTFFGRSMLHLEFHVGSRVAGSQSCAPL